MGIIFFPRNKKFPFSVDERDKSKTDRVVVRRKIVLGSAVPSTKVRAREKEFTRCDEV